MASMKTLKGTHLALLPANSRAIEQNAPEMKTYGQRNLCHEQEQKPSA
jgi:hypothetical protein